jgi:hypothetical protein
MASNASRRLRREIEEAAAASLRSAWRRRTALSGFRRRRIEPQAQGSAESLKDWRRNTEAAES